MEGVGGGEGGCGDGNGDGDGGWRLEGTMEFSSWFMIDARSVLNDLGDLD